MTRTQIQLPDEVYRRARQVCAVREISFAELARRGIEYMLSVYPPSGGSDSDDWEPPTSQGLKLEWSGLNNRKLKEIAQGGETDKVR